MGSCISNENENNTKDADEPYVNENLVNENLVNGNLVNEDLVNEDSIEYFCEKDPVLSSNLLILGYLKQCERNIFGKLSKSNPYYNLQIMHKVCFMYYNIPYQWDLDKKQHSITVSNKNLTIKGARSNGFIKWKHILSNKSVLSAEWEITVGQITENDRRSDLCMSMGYYDAQHEPRMYAWLGQNQYQVGVYLHNNAKFRKYHDCKESYPFDPKWTGSIVKSGDRLKLEFDFKTKECKLYHNDEYVGVLADDLPDEIYPAFSIHFPVEYTCTQWNVRYK